MKLKDFNKKAFFVVFAVIIASLACFSYIYTNTIEISKSEFLASFIVAIIVGFRPNKSSAKKHE